MSTTLEPEKSVSYVDLGGLNMTETQWQYKSVSNINGSRNKEQAMAAAVLVQIKTADIRNNTKRVPTTTRSYITIISVQIQPFDSSFKSSTMLIFDATTVVVAAAAAAATAHAIYILFVYTVLT